jgi:hypothetical protein
MASFGCGPMSPLAYRRVTASDTSLDFARFPWHLGQMIKSVRIVIRKHMDRRFGWAVEGVVR